MIAALRDAQRSYDIDRERAEASRAKRDQLLIMAIESGQRHKQIMEATGLSRTRLNQIKKGTR